MAGLERARPRPPIVAWGAAALAFLLLYLPLGALILYSFLEPRAGQALNWTWRWYVQVLHDEAVLDAIRVSLEVAVLSTLLSSLIGTMAALALERSLVRGRAALDVLVHVPIIMPEIVLGLALLVWFVALKLTLGVFSVVLAHVTFSVSYVIITVRARLADFDRSLEEAAQDLGAGSWQVFRRVTLPLIRPAVLAGALMAFTLSFDDFLITFFTAGVGSDTLPLKIYSMIKFGVSPEINALSTLLIGATLALVLVFSRRLRNR